MAATEKELLSLLEWAVGELPRTFEHKDCKIPQFLRIKQILKQKGEENDDNNNRNR